MVSEQQGFQHSANFRPNTRLNLVLNEKARGLIYFFIYIKYFLYWLQREIFLIWLQEADREDSDRFMEGITTTEPRNNTNNNNNEAGNKEGEIWVELNGSQNNHNKEKKKKTQSL